MPRATNWLAVWTAVIAVCFILFILFLLFGADWLGR